MARILFMGILVAALSAAGMYGASAAEAQTQPVAPDGDDVSNDIKGTVGLGLIGGEVGMLIPGLVGLPQTWARVVFPLVGAGGGAAAGYFVFEKGDPSPQLTVAMLATGVGLIIPSLVASLALLQDDLAEMDEEETASVQRPRSRRVAVRDAGPGLVRLDRQGAFVGVPAIERLPLVPLEQRHAHASVRGTETRFTLFSGRF